MQDSDPKLSGSSSRDPLWALVVEVKGLSEWLRSHSKLATQRDLDKFESLIMTAIEELTDAVNKNSEGQAALTTAVNAAIVKLGTPGPTDPQLNTLTATVKASTASDTALTEALNAALNPPVV